MSSACIETKATTELEVGKVGSMLKPLSWLHNMPRRRVPPFFEKKRGLFGRDRLCRIATIGAPPNTGPEDARHALLSPMPLRVASCLDYAVIGIYSPATNPSPSLNFWIFPEPVSGHWSTQIQ